MAAREVVSGKSPLRSHLRSILPALRRHPCLLVSSTPPPQEPGAPPQKVDQTLKVFTNDVDDYVKKASFISSSELGLRTVNATLFSAYPTWNDVSAGVGLAGRSGVTTVLGVGAGSAVDLAKAAASVLSRRGDVGLVLAPATLGAAMASMSPGSMLLSREEEALLPPELVASDALAGVFLDVGATVVLDADAMAVPYKRPNSATGAMRKGSIATIVDAALASLTICIDAADAISGEDDGKANTLIENGIENSLSALSHWNGAGDGSESELANLAKHHAIAAVVHAGQLLNFGVGTSARKGRRSIPLALASSLLPRYFPHGHVLTFFASLMPGLSLALFDQAKNAEAVESVALSITGGGSVSDLAQWADSISKDSGVPTMASLAEGTPDVAAMMARLDANAALLNCQDAGYEILEEVLKRSLNR